jgi:glutathione S-transferase
MVAPEQGVRALAAKETTFFMHHYEASPYAEKIRAMFGLTGHRWGSVLSPPYPPRPNIDPLAGGYRRIPVAQSGADIFCDTALIATEVAEFTGHPELAPVIDDPAVLALVERAEGAVFFAAITSVSPLRLLGKLLISNGPVSTVKFVRDRAGMMKGASVQPPRGKDAAQMFDEFLAELDRHLADRETIDGKQISYADFCIYHPIWLALSVGGAKTLHQYACLRGWLQRMDGLGQGGREEMRPSDAFDAARDCEPRDLPDGEVAHESVGKEVTIAPADYGKVGVTGTLVAASNERYILARDTERFGTVHVHFPREGYAVT